MFFFFGRLPAVSNQFNLQKRKGHFFSIKKEIITDIDECAEKRDKCDPPTSVCFNTDGGYICKCAPGFEGTGGSCVGR